jgi:hypothetical protein
MSFEVFSTLLMIVLGMLTAAGLPYLVVERRWRWRWREVTAGEIAAHDDGATGVYRVEGTVPTYLRKAPRLVRVAAFSCILFGQMFVPGLLLGAFGLLAGGIGMVSIPGLITAAKLYRAGFALLRREPRVAYFAARGAATWALWLNGVIFGLFVMVALLTRTASNDFWGLFVFVNGYGALSAMQALLLVRATGRWEDALFAPSQLVPLAAAETL